MDSLLYNKSDPFFRTQLKSHPLPDVSWPSLSERLCISSELLWDAMSIILGSLWRTWVSPRVGLHLKKYSPIGQQVFSYLSCMEPSDTGHLLHHETPATLPSTCFLLFSANLKPINSQEFLQQNLFIREQQRIAIQDMWCNGGPCGSPGKQRSGCSFTEKWKLGRLFQTELFLLGLPQM